MTLPERVLAAVKAVAGKSALVDLYGSSVYAPAYAHDVDVLVSHDDPHRLAAALGFELYPTTPPRMHGVIEGMDVDVTVVNGDDDHARRMRLGPRDAAALAAYIGDRDEVFQATWPHVRTFVRQRALGHNGLGWFGSFGWAILLAVPLVTELKEAAGAALPAWVRWLSRLGAGARINLDGVHGGDAFFLAAPSPPLRDVARLSKRAAAWLVADAKLMAAAIGDAATDLEALERLGDLADAPPAGTTLVIAGDAEKGRGRYDGSARGLLRELEILAAVRSWGRFDLDGAGGWEHRITVPDARRDKARQLIEHWLAVNNIDATVS